MTEPIADAVIVENGTVLLVQQRQQSAYGLWGFPGGHIETGETSEEAVIREIQEELGVALLRVKPFRTRRLKIASGELELNTFTGELNGPVILKDDELMAYGWFSLESLQTMQEKFRVPTILEYAQEVLISPPAANR